MYTRLYFPLFLVLLAGLSFWVVISAGRTSTKTFLQVQAAPSGAAIAIDGHSVSLGKDEVDAGTHTVTATRKGFATQTQSVPVKAGQTVYVGVILQPNASSTKNWYKNHASDQQLSQTIADQEANYHMTADPITNPFLRQLPISYGDGLGGLVTIDQGIPLPGTSQPAIYVTADMPTTRQQVLEYMRSRGYDPATMDIIFYGTVDPLQEAGTEDYR
jgi:hypothetical protein